MRATILNSRSLHTYYGHGLVLMELELFLFTIFLLGVVLSLPNIPYVVISY